jgi:hypothetical protein
MRARRWAVLVLVAGGCGYRSSYAPPVDGRARVAWDGARATTQLESARPSDACLNEVRRLLSEGPPPTTAGAAWVPPARRRAETGATVPPPEPSSPSLPAPSGSGAADLGPALGGPQAVVLAAVAAVGLFVAAFALPFEDPEAHRPAANSIDVVNALNDAARTPGSPCAPPAEPGR